MTKALIALYEDYDTAQDMLAELLTVGVRREDVNIITSYASREYSAYLSELDLDDDGLDRDQTGDDDVTAEEGAAAGAIAGGLIGLGMALIPGIGPVLAAGPLIAAVTGGVVGAVTGAATGGLVAALVDLDLDEDEAGAYAEGVRRGGALVIVEVEDALADEVEDIMEDYDPVDLEERTSQWRATGWTGFDPSAPALEPEHIGQETTGTAPTPRNQPAYDTEPGAYERGYSRPAATAEPHISQSVTGYNEDASPQYQAQAGGAAIRGEARGGNVGDSRDVEDANPSNDDMGDVAYSDQFDVYEKDLRRHYDTNYAGTGITYERYLRAYRYGYDLSRDEQYRGREWREIEPEARRRWESEYTDAPWNSFADAIRHMWGQTRPARPGH